MLSIESVQDKSNELVHMLRIYTDLMNKMMMMGLIMTRSHSSNNNNKTHVYKGLLKKFDWFFGFFSIWNLMIRCTVSFSQPHHAEGEHWKSAHNDLYFYLYIHDTIENDKNIKLYQRYTSHQRMQLKIRNVARNKR